MEQQGTGAPQTIPSMTDTKWTFKYDLTDEDQRKAAADILVQWDTLYNEYWTTFENALGAYRADGSRYLPNWWSQGAPQWLTTQYTQRHKLNDFEQGVDYVLHHGHESFTSGKRWSLSDRFAAESQEEGYSVCKAAFVHLGFQWKSIVRNLERSSTNGDEMVEISRQNTLNAARAVTSILQAKHKLFTESGFFDRGGPIELATSSMTAKADSQQVDESPIISMSSAKRRRRRDDSDDDYVP